MSDGGILGILTNWAYSDMETKFIYERSDRNYRLWRTRATFQKSMLMVASGNHSMFVLLFTLRE